MGITVVADLGGWKDCKIILSEKENICNVRVYSDTGVLLLDPTNMEKGRNTAGTLCMIRSKWSELIAGKLSDQSIISGWYYKQDSMYCLLNQRRGEYYHASIGIY